MLWIPGQGPDAEALKRMEAHFPRPKKPMGEYGFMDGSPRHMCDELLEMNIDSVSNEQLLDYLEEACGWKVNIDGGVQEWSEWFFFLLPHALKPQRFLGASATSTSSDAYMGECLASIVTTLFHRYPTEITTAYPEMQQPGWQSEWFLMTTADAHYPGSYPEFSADLMATLGVALMAPGLWEDGENWFGLQCPIDWRNRLQSISSHPTDNGFCASLFFAGST